MKLFLIIFLIVNISSCNQYSGSSSEEKKHEHSKIFYTCSMHPQIKEDKHGKCPICGMGLTKVEQEQDAGHEIAMNEQYYCESDPSITSEAPGECPIDGTQMLKKDLSSNTVGTVKLRKSQVSHFKADLYEASYKKMKKNIRLLGSLSKAESKQSNIPARTSGRVEKVLINSTGSFVKKGMPVLELYSPKLLSGAEEFLLARTNYLTNKDNIELKELYEQSIQRMKLWGILESQLNLWAKENRVPRNITIYSPVSGIVEKKNAIKGKYFQEGESFFDLVDLSTLWVELDVYEHDTGLIEMGQQIQIEFGAYPGKIWNSSIDFVSPILNTKTRTLKVRATLSNENGELKPGMVGTASLEVVLKGAPIVIPRNAVIDTGKRKVIWIEVNNKKYQAKSIKTGFESQGFVEVKEGVEIGDKVVIDGNFLLDAQAQLFGGFEESSEKHNKH